MDLSKLAKPSWHIIPLRNISHVSIFLYVRVGISKLNYFTEVYEYKEKQDMQFWFDYSIRLANE